MLIYLSGPITGFHDGNASAFARASAKVQAAYPGAAVFNPLDSFGGDLNLARELYMRVDMAVLAVSDLVVVLRGWEQSEGAKAEIAFARACGKHITYL